MNGTLVAGLILKLKMYFFCKVTSLKEFNNVVGF
jgi:hypothetical protein